MTIVDTKATFVGSYNELSFSVERIDKYGSQEVHTAGNSTDCDQVYTSPEKGLGLENMKNCCEAIAKAYAANNNGEYGGIYYAV